MRARVFEWGRAHGRTVLAHYTRTEGVCECGTVGVVWDDGGLPVRCGVCLLDDLRYWERRSGGVMDFDIAPRDGSRVDRVMRAGAWQAIAEGLVD